MSPKKLEKLKEQVFQKADSKLYIPLAEEYKKINMTEDAVKVLKYCISKHPSYMSARVALGKIYMEEGYVASAIEEFETVVAAIPDNLLAHKKLAQLYMATGNTTGALASLEKILILNPNDEQAQESIRDLKAQPQDEEVTTDLITASDSDDTTTDIEQDPDTEDLDAQAGIELLKQAEQEIPMTPLQQQLHDIDQYIESERFLVAVMAYNKLLKEHPDSNEIKQRRMEAIRYARLLKKDETVLIHKLDTFCKKLKEYNKA
ncbi:MAG: tetratricopeptide repeat protein [Candidatus Magnetobacterium sp. LHC-1]|uniref:Tetratricopeptide repeat protein n=1 Tax=Candidatus Magnetobacterium casense TaxID=1455061 RepID=A0ABS6RXQ7_9BACT|nr:tetratricopeptide repeat protein [Candidatus Magnetobacterium casensis]MBF0608396.1 tetratricopeptide repeat protein [Nitrospirota bacterium]MBV6341401.1 tetratricopeptide repeat protein [Candidatus Magnetobacterium casensis]